MNLARQHATQIWMAGLDAVRAEGLVRREVVVDVDSLLIDGHEFHRSDFDRIILVGGGKAGAAMAVGLARAVGDWLPIVGWINVPEGTQCDLPGIRVHPARPAGVNEPTAEGVEGVLQMLQWVRSADSRDLCVALISGGGSALMPAPIPGVTLSDKLRVTRFLSAAGADITELNTVRKHLSIVKGGGLLRACRAGHLVTLVLSDVLGDSLDLIASGPTVLDMSTAREARTVLERFDPNRTLPSAVYAALEGQAASTADAENRCAKNSHNGVCPHTTIVIGNNAVAVDEAGVCAERLGYNHVMQSARTCEGNAEDVGRHLASMTMQMLRADPEDHRLDCLITGGEPVVKLAPVEVRGRGGRNQQLVLAAYQWLCQENLSSEQWQRICILSGGTDGEDGPTDAAGAFIDQKVHAKAIALKLDVAAALQRNDAYTFFAAAGGLLTTGPTGTNVCDVRVALVTR
ncbi:putative hydroxypyruvate reductase [Rubripirellula tenax]|uniref:Putative hydroxypyruvate reductase n=1 Tax=Rubripirellula tenax TaxID=2528015 RepID=A0A5C6EKX9_9BACT|nr:DUF4147 domain-containing protein [Rubripirellula tenax]TWU48767.1 putative hydroxypyruvate reductase [Rubripirellula tenax]